MQPVRSFHPYIPSSMITDVKNNEVEPESKDPVPAGYQAVVEKMSLPTCSAKAKQRLGELLRVYPLPMLEKLADFGLKYDIKEGVGALGAGGGDTAVMGGYSPSKTQIGQARSIVFGELTIMSRIGRHVVLHETAHALDHMNGEQNFHRFGRQTMASFVDPKLHELYARYQCRAAVELVDPARWMMQQQGKTGNKETLEGQDSWGTYHVDYTKGNGQETFLIDQTPNVPPLQKALREMMVGDKGYSDDLPDTHLKVPLRSGGDADVTQIGLRSTIVIPEGATPYSGMAWTEYGARAVQIQEYYAEGVSQFLEGGRKALELQRRDPDMYEYSKAQLGGIDPPDMMVAPAPSTTTPIAAPAPAPPPKPPPTGLISEEDDGSVSFGGFKLRPEDS